MKTIGRPESQAPVTRPTMVLVCLINEHHPVDQ